jgi:xanthine dehydrogenase accessory factor
VNDICKILAVIKRMKADTFALATIIQVQGSSYRREGAKLLISGDGSLYGMITPGCLEQDLLYYAKEVIQTGQSKLITYDLKAEDDFAWGRGIGCNGIIKIYVEPISWNQVPLAFSYPIWPQLEEYLNRGQRIVAAKYIEEPHIGKVLYLAEDDQVLQGANTDDFGSIVTTMREMFDNSSKAVILDDIYFVEKWDPKEVLYIFGAGPDAEPLVNLASKLDFSVQVVDPREDRCNEINFPTADRLIVEHPHTFLASTVIPPQSYVIIMTHSFQWDQQILQHFLRRPPRYLGILGPRLRTKRLLMDQFIPDWVHSPIGIDIYAEGAKEISVSILGELIHERNRLRRPPLASI